ncbi:uncharacterized protein ppp1r3aa isoform X1 [Astyanax mexicanus]|uniref:uncharacterized protein ppp1r3aa isoform X1 n=1 Tax=Astyanax mexicanus TaxID=7994 RepID=UPI0020CAAD05|nr:uncharacterized protein ppp1r3aa isoform X1 [Astyanax mexicanus]
MFSCNLSHRVQSRRVWGISGLPLCFSLTHTQCTGMSAEEPGLSAASRCMETTTLHVWPRDEGEEEDGRDEEHYEETKEPERSSSDESEESEAEPPSASAVRRKVSFADAFGLDLVKVKEFDSRSETGPKTGEEYYISCLFTVPSSEEELLSLLQQTKLEVESIELLPGSTTIRGIVRVLNLAYHKTIYVRTTLDGWQSHFDLLAEYLPGSSDGQTDRFTFKLILVPPFPAEGTRVEFCLRYESKNGTFWSSNGGMNYVLFCHHRGRRELRESEGEKERETEDSNQKGKKSCLKASRKWSNADLKSKGMSSDLSDPESCRSEESEKERIQQKAESRSSQPPEECRKTLVERRNRRRAARLARVQDYFSQREPEAQLGHHPRRETTVVEMPALQLSTPIDLDSSGVFQVNNKKDMDTPPILTYHQIPLLSLDWGKSIDPSSHPHNAEISSGKGLDVPKDQLTVSSTDAWEAFLSGTDTSDTHSNAVDQECLLHTPSLPPQTECDMSISSERRQDFAPSNTTEEALAYKLVGKPGITSKNCNVYDLARSETQIKSSEISFSEDMPLIKISQHRNAMESQNSRGHEVTHEECKGKAGSLVTEDEVKGDINEVAHSALTFTEFRDEPFTSGHMGTERPLERLTSLDKEKEPKQVTENISEKDENAEQLKAKFSFSESNEELMINEEPFHLEDQNAEMISVSKRLLLDHKELDTTTKWTDREASKPQGQEETMCQDPENKRLMETTTERTSVALSMTSHASETSGPFSWKESVRDSETLLFSEPHKDFEFDETAAQMRVKTYWSKCSEDLTVGQESGKQRENEKLFHLEHQNTESISISISENMVLDEEELHGMTDRKSSKPEAQEEAMCHKPENERSIETIKEIPSIVVDNNRADRQSEVSSTTIVTMQKEPYETDKIMLGRKSKSDTSKDFIIGQEPHTTHRTTDLCTGSSTLSISSHASDTSGPFGSNESIRDCEPLLLCDPHKDFKFGETLPRHASDTSGPLGSTESVRQSEPLLFSDPHKGLELAETLPRQDEAQMNVKSSWTNSSEEMILKKESRKQIESKEPFHLRDQNAKNTSVTEILELDEKELDASMECPDREASKLNRVEEVKCNITDNERLKEKAEKISSPAAVDTNVVDRESEVSSTTIVVMQKEPYEADEVTLGRKSKSDTCQDVIIGQLHKTHRTTDLCTGSPTLTISSHASDTSGSFGSTECVRHSEPLLFSGTHKGFECAETLPRQEPIVGIESAKQRGNEESFHLEDQNLEIISMSESVLLDEEDLDSRTEWPDREASKKEGTDEATFQNPENNKRLEKNKEIPSVVEDDSEVDRESEVSSTTNVTTRKEPYEADEVTLGSKSKSDTCQDFIIGQEPHTTHRITDLCTGSPTLTISSHASDTSGPFSLTESVRDNELLLFSGPHKDFGFEETLPRQDGAQKKSKTSCSKSSEEIIIGLESREQDEEPFQLGDQNSEVITMSENMMLDEEELDAVTEWSDWKGAKPENDRLIGTNNEIPSVVVENNIADENKVSSTTNVTTQEEPYEVDEVVLGRRESTVGLESGNRGGNEESFHLEDQSTEIISMSESTVLDEDEFDARTNWSDRDASKPDGKEEATFHNLENKRLMEITEETVVVDISVTDGQSEISSTTKVTAQKEQHEADEAMLGKKSTSDNCKDITTVQDSHKPHRTIDICACTLTLSITSHSSDTESVKDSEPLLISDPLKSSECGETLRNPAAQDLQELQDPDSEVPAPLSSMPTPAVCTVSSRLMTWWADFCSLGHISKALLYTVLFVIFITVYLHDLPIFLAIYLLSMCWWCGQGMNKHETTADSVD